MGCDIDVYIERFYKGKWVMVDRVPIGAEACKRNYERFCKLAGVRCYEECENNQGTPRGLPKDVSESLKYLSEDYGDGHSHSWMPLKEFIGIIESTLDESRREKFKSEYFRSYDIELIEEDDNLIDEYRVVFWFDN